MDTKPMPIFPDYFSLDFGRLWRGGEGTIPEGIVDRYQARFSWVGSAEPWPAVFNIIYQLLSLFFGCAAEISEELFQ
jgi:hypothetical protein